MSDDKGEADSNVEGSSDQAKPAPSEPAKQGFGILAARFLKKTSPAVETGEHPTIAAAKLETTAQPAADDDVLILDDLDDSASPTLQKETGEIPEAAEHHLGSEAAEEREEIGAVEAAEEREEVGAVETAEEFEPAAYTPEEEAEVEPEEPVAEQLPESVANEEEHPETVSYEVVEEPIPDIRGFEPQFSSQSDHYVVEEPYQEGEEVHPPGYDQTHPSEEEVTEPVLAQYEESEQYSSETSAPDAYSTSEESEYSQEVSAVQEEYEPAQPASSVGYDEVAEANPADVPGGYSKAELDALGTGGFSQGALDAIGSAGYSKAELDSLGTSGGFAKSELDSIGTSGGFAKSELDLIGSAAPAAEPAVPEAKEKSPETGKAGLMGGTFGRKAKSFLDKRPGQISSTSAAIEQRDTPQVLQNQFTPLAKKTEPVREIVKPPKPEPASRPAAAAAKAEEVVAKKAALDAEDAAGPSEDLTAPTEYLAAPTEDLTEPTEDLTEPTEYLAEPTEDLTEPEAAVAEPVLPATDTGRLLADADAAFSLRQYAAAEPIYARVLEKLEKAGADHDPLLVACLDRSGDNYFELRKYKEALPLYRKLIILHEKLSSTDRDLISAMYKIAKTSEKLNLTTEADSMYKRAFRLGQQSLVPGDPLLANVLEGYGTMLMRSEGADAGAQPAAEAPPPPPPIQFDIPAPRVVADGRAAGIQSMLSPEEIALLNRLEVKAEEAAAKPPGAAGPAASPAARPAAPSAAPVGDATRAPRAVPGAGQTETTGKRAALREAEDKIKYRPPSTGGTPPGSLEMAARMIILVGLVLGGMQYFFSAMRVNYAKPKPVEIKVIPGKYTGNVFKALDGLTIFTIWTDKTAYKEFLSSKITYDYKPWVGNFADDMDMFTGKIHDKDIGFKVEEGFKDPEGNLLYRIDAPEHEVVINMRDVGTKVQAYYKAHGKYPEGAELAKAAKIPYKNPFVGGPETVTTHSIKWPKDLNAKQIFLMSPFDTKLENGGTWEGESGNAAGEISALSTHTTNPTASACYVHGRDRHGELMKRSDGKVLLLVYKNGLDVTPVATLPVVKDDKQLVPLRVTSEIVAPNFLTIIVGYLIMVAFLAGSIFFAIRFLIRLRKKKGYSTRPSIILPFASIWSLLMFSICLTPKFAPDNIGDIAKLTALPVFMLGLIFMLVYLQVTKPKARKPGT